MEMNQVDFIVKQERISNAMKYFVTIIITYTNTRKLKTYRLRWSWPTCFFFSFSTKSQQNKKQNMGNSLLREKGEESIAGLFCCRCDAVTCCLKWHLTELFGDEFVIQRTGDLRIHSKHVSPQLGQISTWGEKRGVVSKESYVDFGDFEHVGGAHEGVIIIEEPFGFTEVTYISFIKLYRYTNMMNENNLNKNLAIVKKENIRLKFEQFLKTLALNFENCALPSVEEKFFNNIGSYNDFTLNTYHSYYTYIRLAQFDWVW